MLPVNPTSETFEGSADVIWASAEIAVAADPASPYRAKVEVPLITDLLAAAGDGITNCAATLARTDADSFVLPAGDYRVSSSCTIQRPVYFMAGAKITIDAGVVVTFSGRGSVKTDSRRQVFYGAGSANIAGLPVVDVAWFAGDKIYQVSDAQLFNENGLQGVTLGADARSELVAAFASIRSGAKIYLQQGALTLGSGTTYVRVDKRVNIIGSRAESIFIFSTTNTYGFEIYFPRSDISGLYIKRANLDVPAVAGVALRNTGAQLGARDICIVGARIGVSQENVSGGAWTNIEIRDSTEIGMNLKNTNDVCLDKFFFVAQNEWIAFNSPSGGWNPQRGATLTGNTSGAKFTWERAGVAAKHWHNHQAPIVGETFTSSSGGTAVLASYTPVVSDAQLNVQQDAAAGVSAPFMEALLASNGDIIGGVRGLRIHGPGAGYREAPSFNRFSNVFFDSSTDAAASILNSDGTTFVSSWFSSKLYGVILEAGARSVRFVGCDIRDCAYAGVLLAGAIDDINFVGCTLSNNMTGFTTPGSQVYVTTNTVGRVRFYGGVIGTLKTSGLGTIKRANYGIDLAGSAGGIGHLVLDGVSFANHLVAPIVNLHQIVDYSITNCAGLRTRAQGLKTIGAGNTATSTFSHGIDLPVTDANVVVTPYGTGGLGGAVYASAKDTGSATTALWLVNGSGGAFSATRNATLRWEIDVSRPATN